LPPPRGSPRITWGQAGALRLTIQRTFTGYFIPASTSALVYSRFIIHALLLWLYQLFTKAVILEAAKKCDARMQECKKGGTERIWLLVATRDELPSNSAVLPNLGTGVKGIKGSYHEIGFRTGRTSHLQRGQTSVPVDFEESSDSGFQYPACQFRELVSCARFRANSVTNSDSYRSYVSFELLVTPGTNAQLTTGR